MLVWGITLRSGKRTISKVVSTGTDKISCRGRHSGVVMFVSWAYTDERFFETTILQEAGFSFIEVLIWAEWVLLLGLGIGQRLELR